MNSMDMQIIRKTLCEQDSGLSEGWRGFLASERPAAIYGAGRQATVVYDFCKMIGKSCAFLLTKDSRSRWGMLPREEQLPLYSLDEIPPDMNTTSYDVIVAVNPKYNSEIIADLRSHGWQHIYHSDNWESDNARSRSIFFRNYLLQRGAYFIKDANGHEILCITPPRGREFVIYFDLDLIYQAAFLGDIGNILMPSLFEDYSLTGVYGPCEFGSVKLRPGDIVLDLGACIGEFSCLAAAKGCQVHAFEPTPDTVNRYLKKNALLYNNFYVENKAVLDYVGVATLYINKTYDESNNITRNSIFQHLEPSYTPITVTTTTIDKYVMDKNIQKVDFIKSHTEYSELKAFQGAAVTIKKFAPKLCFWGSIYASQLMQLLLSINPDYQFDLRWGNKIFAWVEK